MKTSKYYGQKSCTIPARDLVWWIAVGSADLWQIAMGQDTNLLGNRAPALCRPVKKWAHQLEGGVFLSELPSVAITSTSTEKASLSCQATIQSRRQWDHLPTREVDGAPPVKQTLSSIFTGYAFAFLKWWRRDISAVRCAIIVFGIFNIGRRMCNPPKHQIKSLPNIFWLYSKC